MHLLLPSQPPYRVMHPKLLRARGDASTRPSRAADGQRSSPHSLNWNLAEQVPELVDGGAGLVSSLSSRSGSVAGGLSRLSKASIFEHFKRLEAQLGRQSNKGDTYRQAKDRACGYHEAKEAVRRLFEGQTGGQVWSRRSLHAPDMEAF